jgi:hypothetical protein
VTSTTLRGTFESAAPATTVDLDCIVFSKDRPMQLDACLRSISRDAPYRGSITVVYRATTDRFRRGYAELETDARVRLHSQGDDFRAAVLEVLRDTGGLIVFHTDDDLFFRTPPRAPLLPAGCVSFSLRLGENTTFCYPFQRDQRLPRREQVGDFMVWEWARADHDFGYPMSLDGHIFDGDLVRALAAHARFRDPNELERELHLMRYRAPRLMASFRHSSVVSVPVNVVTDSIANRSGVDPRFAPEALNDLFLQGVRIDLDGIDFTNVHAAHQELAIAFSNANGGQAG